MNQDKPKIVKCKLCGELFITLNDVNVCELCKQTIVTK